MAEEQEQERIVIPDENGEEHLFNILFSFTLDETERSYMIVEPEAEAKEEGEEHEVYAFRFEEDGEDFSLYPIETDKEWDMVEEMLNTLANEEQL